MFIPAFEYITGIYLDYDAVHAAGIQGLTIMPQIRISDESGARYLQMDCLFEERDLSRTTYGSPTGDSMLRTELTDRLVEILPEEFSGLQFIYAGFGEDDDDGKIVMLGGEKEIALFDGLSSHEWIALLPHPEIEIIMLDGQKMRGGGAIKLPTTMI